MHPVKKRGIKLKRILTFIIGVGIAVSVALVPLETTIVPEWKIRVVEANGASADNVTVRQFWKHYSLELDGAEIWMIESRMRMDM